MQISFNVILMIITKTTDKSHMDTDESKRATDRSQMIHGQLQTNPTERFFESIYKTLFSERILFSKCSNKSFGLTLKEESPVFE